MVPDGHGADPARARAAVEAVWRIESARLVAGLARLTRDVGLAEDLAQEALLAALEQWPAAGVPDNPGAWLATIARRRAVDVFRRNATLDDRHRVLAAELAAEDADPAPHGLDLAALDREVQDDLLGLIFTVCHPVLSQQARVALTLRLLGGLRTDEIARAFLVPEATVAQRIVRAKRTLTAANVPFEVPRGADLTARLPAVLEVVYLIFNEGYAATAGEDWVRDDLCREALRLGRVLAALAPEEPEALALSALMELQASRTGARTGPDGRPVLLLDQDRRRWDRLLIRRGLDALRRMDALGHPYGPYGLQAAIAACHAMAPTAGATEWGRIAALYDGLAAIAPSPVVELNRAVALAMAFGPEAGLEVVDALRDGGRLAEYHLLPSVRGDLLVRLGRPVEARAEFIRAAELTRNERERTLLLERAAACAWRAPS
ncbi:sigma-70 family RNA polymerase sigma factor [Patulibacter sp. NPDC049589]|uniref:RNA polymerase sigma factor n=1 Tax=Patulibacter sp. NPDC049589 TaxID=3154731 RepID=UPI00344473DB